ncbi:MAG: PQQ-dependent sugar dehydrogenase [Chthoniobacteraceae bacterium]
MKTSKYSQPASILATVFVLSATVHAQQDVLPPIQPGSIAIGLQTIATGLGAPDYAVAAPGDASRLFILEQKGQVLILQNGSLLPTPALDISSLISNSLNPASANDERGLLGIAFHPGFNDPQSVGYHTVYTYNSQPLGTGATYAAPNNATQTYRNVVNEYKMSLTDPNVIDPSTRREVISFAKNATNHNGGTIAFGPDGYMYLGLGDGGNANDVGASHIEPGGNAQNLSTPLGKMLRIDPINPTLNGSSSNPVSGNGQYRIPTTNPFQGPGQVPEIYALGLRNPYRFAFDRLNGQLIAADVGQNTVEEIDRIVLGGNYGWAVKEGDFLFNRTTTALGTAGTVGVRSPGSPAGLIDPITGTLGILEYDHGDGISITGGFVYRGTAIPDLYGKYVFGDLALHNLPPRADGRLFYADLDTGIINEFQLPQFSTTYLPNGLTVHGFGEDADGELYALVTNTPANGAGGMILKITAIPEPTAAIMGLVCLGFAAVRRQRVVCRER